MNFNTINLPPMPAAFFRAVEDLARALSNADQLDRENLVSMVRDLENSLRSTADRTAWDLDAVQASVANQRRILQAVQRLLLAATFPERAQADGSME